MKLVHSLTNKGDDFLFKTLCLPRFGSTDFWRNIYVDLLFNNKDVKELEQKVVDIRIQKHCEFQRFKNAADVIRAIQQQEWTGNLKWNIEPNIELTQKLIVNLRQVVHFFLKHHPPDLMYFIFPYTFPVGEKEAWLLFLLQNGRETMHALSFQKFVREIPPLNMVWPYTWKENKSLKRDIKVYKEEDVPFPSSTRVVAPHEYSSLLKRLVESCFKTVAQKWFDASIIATGSFAIVGELTRVLDCQTNEILVFETPVLLRFESCGDDTNIDCSFQSLQMGSLLSNQAVQITPKLFYGTLLTFRTIPFREMSFWEYAGNSSLQIIARKMKKRSLDIDLKEEHQRENNILACLLFVCYRVVQLWMWGFVHFDLHEGNVVFTTEQDVVNNRFEMPNGQYIQLVSNVTDAKLIDLTDVYSITKQYSFIKTVDEFFSSTPEKSRFTKATIDQDGNWMLGADPFPFHRIQNPYEMLPMLDDFRLRFPLLQPASASIVYFILCVQMRYECTPFIESFCKRLSAALVYQVKTPEDVLTTLQSLLTSKEDSDNMKTHTLVPFHAVPVQEFTAVEQDDFW